jgi:hypothetical protein
VAQDINLIALAAWLHLQSEQAEAAANSDGDEYGARATLETAARLAQASRVVKEAADQETGARRERRRAPGLGQGKVRGRIRPYAARLS